MLINIITARVSLTSYVIYALDTELNDSNNKLTALVIRLHLRNEILGHFHKAVIESMYKNGTVRGMESIYGACTLLFAKDDLQESYLELLFKNSSLLELPV